MKPSTIKNIKQFAQTSTCDDCQNARNSPPLPRNPSGNVSSDVTSEKVLEDINKKLEVIYCVEKKIQDLTTSIEFYGEMYQRLIEFKEEAQKKIKSLEQKNIYLEKCNTALEERIQEIEMREKEKKA